MKPNWPTKKLGEIRKEIKKEKAPIGAMPYIEIGNVNIESKKVNFTKKGAVKGSVFCPEESILISRVRPTRGAVVLANKKYAVSSAFTIIQPKINPRLLFYFLAWNKKFFEYLKNLQKGTSYPSVRESDILDFEVSFPEGKVEQKKIVYVLDSIQKVIRVQEKIIEKTKELKKMMMKKLFTEGTRGAKLKKTEIGEIPENWEVINFENSLNRKAKFLVGELKQKDYQIMGKYPIIDQSEEFITGYSDTKNLVYRGSLPVVIFGDHTRVVKFIDFPFIIGGSGIKILIPIKEFDINYFYYLISGLNIESRGYNRHFGILKEKLIPKPSLIEQREIAEILQTIDQKIEIEQKKKALYEELFETMLNKLMNGEIKVDNLRI
ncbi:MAG: Restriction endonuclease [Parcubacteria bacterium 32_520]|nr:MAG: Restriction endonuclease [Parcubacteria bacterium 32_520]